MNEVNNQNGLKMKPIDLPDRTDQDKTSEANEGQTFVTKKIAVWGAGTEIPTKGDANSTFVWGPIPDSNGSTGDDPKSTFVWG